MMQCEMCKRNAGERRLCSVCAEAVQRVLKIAIEKKRVEITQEPGAAKGSAAGAGH